MFARGSLDIAVRSDQPMPLIPIAAMFTLSAAAILFLNDNNSEGNKLARPAPARYTDEDSRNCRRFILLIYLIVSCYYAVRLFTGIRSIERLPLIVQAS